MSLYNHVANKDDIVDGILDLVAGEIEAPVAGGDWKATLRAASLAAHEAFSRHPWAAGIWMSAGTMSTVRMRHADGVLRCLAEAGFSEDLTYHAYHVLQGYELGFTLQELNFPYGREELERLATRFLRDFPSDEYPHLAEHVRQHSEPREDGPGEFEFGLDLILDGLDRLRAAAR